MRRRKQQVVLILVLCASCLLGAELPETLVVTPPKSVFIDNPNFGRDPFFPKSERRQASEVEPTITDSTGFPAGLELKGLSGVTGKPLAIINNTTFAEGEKGRVKIGGKAFILECLEIADGTVKVRVNGQTRELSLSVE